MTAAGPVLEAPALVELVVGLMWALAWVVTAGILWAYRNTFGYVLTKLADVLVFPGIHGIGRVDFGAPIRALNSEVLSILGTAASFYQAKMGRAFHAAARLAEWGANEILLGMEEVYKGFDWLVHVHIPRRLNFVRTALLGSAALALLIAREVAKHGAGVVKVVEHAVTGGTRVVYRDTVGPLRVRLGKLERRVAAIAAGAGAVVTIPGIIGRGIPLDSLRKRLRQVEWLAAGAGVATLGLTILSRLGLGWTRCSNVGKAGKQVCGMNPSLLESLLADTLLIAGTVSLVEFAKGMQGIVGEIEQPIRAFWRAT